MKLIEHFITATIAASLATAGTLHWLDSHQDRSGAGGLGRLLEQGPGQEDIKPGDQAAYEAFLKLKQQGILVGYPDGKFRGSQQASRYEMAAGLFSVYQKVDERLANLQAQIEQMQGMTSGWQIDDMKNDFAQLQAAIRHIEGLPDEVSSLKGVTAEMTEYLNGTKTSPWQKTVNDTLADHEGRIKKLGGTERG